MNENEHLDKLLEAKIKHLASFPEANPFPIVELNFDAKINYINPSAKRLLGDLGMDESAVRVFFPKNLDKILQRLKKGGVIEKYEELEIKLGNRFFTSAVAFPPGLKSARAYIRESTKRKTAETQVVKESKRLKMAESIAKLGSWELDLVTNTLYWSDEVFSIFEINKKKFGASYSAFLDLIHPEDRETVDRAYAESLKTRQPYKIVHRLKFPDGRIKFIKENCQSQYDKNGRPILSFGSVQDITEQERVKLTLQKSEEMSRNQANRLKTVLDTAPTIIFIADSRDCDNVMGNHAAYKFLRVPDGVNLSKSGSDKDKLNHYNIVQDGRGVALEKMPIQYVAHTGRPLLNFEYQFAFDNGEVRTLFGNAMPVLDEVGKPNGAVGSFIDITIRKQDEEKIRDAKEEWERTFDSVPDLIAILDKHHRIVRANKAMLERLNITAEACAGMNCFKCVHGTNRPPDYCPHSLTLQDGKVHTVDIREDNLGGDFMVSTTPLFDKEGQMAGSVHVARDITEAKSLDRAKTEFISLAAHQLRTPIATIKLTIEMLLLGLAGAVDRENKKYLRNIVDDVNQMAGLVELFLNISRIEMGTFEISPRPANIIMAIDDSLKSISPQLKQKEMRLNKKVASGLPRLNLDARVWSIILENLLSNAIKYSPPKKLITVSAKKTGQEVIIAVADNGYGIPQEQQNKIFEQFFRADNVKDRGIEGSGLGLYMVKLLVELSGGKIWFKSNIDRGATFYVSWPIIGMKKNSAAGQKPKDGALKSYCTVKP